MTFNPDLPFDLPELPPEINFRHDRFIDLLLKTRTELGELNGYSFALPNPLLLLSPAVIKESVASSEIENINTTMEEALQAQHKVTSGEGWIDWTVFMLKALHTQARSTKEVLLKITALLNEMKERIRSNHKKIYSSDLVEALFANPIITPVNLGRRLDIGYRTASRYLTALVDGGVLKDSRVGKYHLYANKKLLKLLREAV